MPDARIFIPALHFMLVTDDLNSQRKLDNVLRINDARSNLVYNHRRPLVHCLFVQQLFCTSDRGFDPQSDQFSVPLPMI